MSSHIDGLMDVVRIDDDEPEDQEMSSADGGPIVTEGSGAGSSADIKLHPLVIINISEHYTRIRAQHGGRGQTVIGALLGQQKGRQIEIFNSFELVPSAETLADGRVVMRVDSEYLDQKSIQLKEVFPKLDLLGWYSTGPEVLAQHREIHDQMLSKNESPLFLLLDPTPRAEARELPLKIFEHVVEMVEAKQVINFVSVLYTIASEEAERIGLDHVAKSSGSAGPDTASEVSLYLRTQRGAVKMLQQRLLIIRNYLRDVKAGVLPPNHAVLRELSCLCSRLPIDSELVRGGSSSGGSGGGGGDSTFLETANEAMLISYMAMITKGFSAITEALDKFPIVHEKALRRNRSWF